MLDVYTPYRLGHRRDARDHRAASLEELVRVDERLAPEGPLDVPAGLPEVELAAKISGYAKRNAAIEYTSFLGAGAYRHYLPPVVMSLAMRGEFLTAYTPYQAEVSQGYLQAIYEWQTYICLLTGLDIANASVYDGATALAEGVDHGGQREGPQESPGFARRASELSRGLAHVRATVSTSTIEELPIAADGTTDFATLEARLADRAICRGRRAVAEFFREHRRAG